MFRQTGEVLTSEACARRMLEKQEKRNAKQKNAKKDSGKQACFLKRFLKNQKTQCKIRIFSSQERWKQHFRDKITKDFTVKKV